MQMVPLQTSARSEDSSKKMRREGSVPCVVYGNVEHAKLQCEEKALKKAYVTAGESTLVELDMNGKKVPVLFHALDFDPVSDRLIHVDFYAVDMKKEIEAEIALRHTGESLAVKDLSAIIVTAMDHVTVRCLPSNLPHDIAVDLSALTEFGSTITVADLKVPEGVTIVNEPDTVLVVAQEPRAEEVVEVAAPVEGAEGAAPADGAAPAAGAPAAAAGAPTGEKK